MTTKTNGEVVSNENESLYENHAVLKDLCDSNAEFFKTDASAVGKNIYSTLLSISNTLSNVRPLLEYFRGIYQAYDFDDKTPGNGYRSYVMMVDAFVVYGVKINRQISHNRNSYFFRKGTALK